MKLMPKLPPAVLKTGAGGVIGYVVTNKLTEFVPAFVPAFLTPVLPALATMAVGAAFGSKLGGPAVIGGVVAGSAVSAVRTGMNMFGGGMSGLGRIMPSIHRQVVNPRACPPGYVMTVFGCARMLR